jgi:hypothetical protein
MREHEIIRKVIQEDLPDMEQIRKNCHREFATQPHAHVSTRRLLPLIAAIVIMLALAATAFAYSGGFAWFIERFNPSFADIVEPVAPDVNSSEDQGIIVTIIGTAHFDTMAVVYLSLQDIEQNRIKEQISFRGGGFSVLTEAELYTGGWAERMLYFDKANSTAYMEIILESDAPISDPLTIDITRIFSESAFTMESIPIPIDLASTAEAEMIFVNGEDFTQLLAHGFVAELPSPHLWISNVGMVDGRLAVQMIQRNDYGSGGWISMRDSEGAEVFHDWWTMRLYADEDFNLIPFEEANMWWETHGNLPPYSIYEMHYEIDINAYGLFFDAPDSRI